MPTRDLYHSINPSSGVSMAPATVSTNASVNGAAVDTFGYESVTVGLIVGARTDGTYTFKVQDSDDGSTNWADLDATCYMGGSAPAGITAAGITFIGLKDCSAASPSQAGQVRRYVRTVETSTSVTTGATGVGSVVILGHPHHRNAAV